MNVVVEEHNPAYAQMFTEEAQRISEIFGDQLVAIHHIGSTAVPGLKAKPIIDILPVVKDIATVDWFNQQMAELGYEALGELGLPGRRYFRKGGDDRTHQVHAYQVDNQPAIDRHLAFRDYLCTHPEVARQYGELKASLAEQFPQDIYGYMDGKDSFVKEHEQKALVWYQSKW